jgi:hydrogenase maturation protease
MKADAATPSPAPVLVLAIGNPSRGDDAVGPLLAEWLAERAPPGVEVMVDYQLQVEHALDLERRERVVFVDACVDADAPAVARRVVPDARFAHTSHALAPAQVLETYRRITGREPPESWMVGIRGERFELGAGLSQVAECGCDAARLLLLELCAR